MKIIKFKKIGKSKYKVFFDNDELILYEDVILKYNLLSKKDISLELLNKILEDNIFYEVYNYALYYIDIKMRNEKELKDYLKRKNYDDNVISEVIEKIKEEGLINDKRYVKAYTNDKINLSLYGPFKIKNELLKSNIEESVIDDYLNTIEEDVWLEKINKIIDKKVKSNKKLSNNYLKKKIGDDLYYLGYDREMFGSLLENININEEKTLEIEYQKAYKKYKNKYNGDKLKKVIREYLIRKGFSYENINNIN